MKIGSFNCGNCYADQNIKKFTDFLDQLKDTDIVALQEAKSNKAEKDGTIEYIEKYIHKLGFNLEDKSEKTKGGLRILVKFQMTAHELYKDEFEYIRVYEVCDLLNINRPRFNLINTYIPKPDSPDKSQEHAFDELDWALGDIPNKNSYPTVVCGDFNTILKETDSNPYLYKKYYSKLYYKRGTERLHDIMYMYDLNDPYKGDEYSTKGGSMSETYGGGARLDRFLHTNNIKHSTSDIQCNDYGSQHRPITLKFR